MKPSGQLLAVFVCCLLALPAIAELLRCPECANMVSDKAPGCPKCGAPIEFIKQKATASTNAPIKDVRNCAVRVVSDAGKGFGVAVEEDGKQFVLFDERLIDGAEQLTLYATTTNQPIAYKSLEVSDDRGLVRVGIGATNVRCLGVGHWLKGAMEVGALSVGTNGTVATNMVSIEGSGGSAVSIKGAVENLVCLCEGTNAIAVAASRALAIPIAPNIRWVAVKPGDYRRQTKLLMKAEGSGTAPAAIPAAEVQGIQKALKETEWLTQHLRERGETASRNFGKKKMNL